MFSFLLLVSFAFSENIKVLSVPLNHTHEINIPHLSKAVLGNGKIAKVRVLEPNTVLVTGLKLGETTLHAWAEKNHFTYLVKIIPIHLSEVSKPISSERVIKISLGFFELNQIKVKELGLKFPEFLEMGAQAFSQGGNNFSGLNYTLSFHTPKTFLNAFINEGEARLIAEPEIFVRLGEEALFHSGGELPVASFSESFGNTQKKVDWKNFGLTFRVKPESSDGYHISSEIKLELSELNEATKVEGVPSVLKRKIETKIDSVEGETLCLSGLVKQMTSQNQRKVPGLSSIPLIGPLLFTSKGNREESTELLVTLKLNFSPRTRP